MAMSSDDIHVVDDCVPIMSEEPNLNRATGSDKERPNQAGNSRGKTGAILCLGGAFNPVHSRHVMALVVGKRWLEDNTNYEIVAGRMAVAPDGYVLTKTRETNQNCIKAEHRIQLCARACKEYNEWMQPYPKPCGSAMECGKRMKKDLEKEKTNSDLKIIVIVGADRAVNKSGFAKWSKESGHITLCIGREGETGQVIEKFERDKAAGKVKHSDFFIVPFELKNVSSTAIRRVLTQMNEDKTEDEKRNIVQQLVKDDFVNVDCAEYILSNQSELYLT